MIVRPARALGVLLLASVLAGASLAAAPAPVATRVPPTGALAVYRENGDVHLQFLIPTRGLIGFRTDFMSLTKGTVVMNSLLAGYAPYAGAIAGERPETFAEAFVDRSENIIGFEVLTVDAAAGADVVAHLFKPSELVGGECDSDGALLF